jgi:hypothetical protein
MGHPAFVPGAKNSSLVPRVLTQTLKPDVFSIIYGLAVAFIESFLQPYLSVGWGCAPSFSAHVRWGEHGAPVQGEGLRCTLGLQVVLGTRLDQGEKLGAGVLLVEDSYHRRGHG